MPSSSLVRWIGLAAIVGGVLGIVLTPPFALGYVLAFESYVEQPFWSPLVKALFPLSFASTERVYYVYGRLYFLILLPELLTLYTWRRTRAGGSGALERWGFRLLLVGMLLMVIGVFGDYWLILLPGFFAELLAIPFLTAGLVLLGLGLWRVATVPRWLSLITVVAGVGTIPVMFLFFHVPSGSLLLSHIVWVATGYILWAGRGVVAEQPSQVR